MMYSLVIAPFVALLLAQCVKIIIDYSRGRFSFADLNRYGGMPSAHSAMVVALATKLALTFGIGSAPFAISACFAFLTIRDAVGFRQTLGTHAAMVNRLVKELPDDAEASFRHLEERIGHSYAQVFVGAILGLLIAYVI